MALSFPFVITIILLSLSQIACSYMRNIPEQGGDLSIFTTAHHLLLFTILVRGKYFIGYRSESQRKTLFRRDFHKSGTVPDHWKRNA